MTATGDLVGGFRERPFPPARIVGTDTVRIGLRRHHIPVLAEVDVTAARSAIARQKAETGEGLSFTGWVIACLGRAAAEHPRVHALRRGRRALVEFEDVDVSIVVQRLLGGTDPPEYLPMPYVIRRANAKTVEAIHAEVRAAQSRALAPGEQTIDLAVRMPSPRAIRVFASVPFFLRNALYWHWLFRDPFRVKRTMGTIAVTSVGMFGEVGEGSNWAVPVEFHPLTVALGAVARKPAVVGDRVEPREFLGVTVVFDHDVVDGAPVARFLQRLRELMEGAYGLEAPPPRRGSVLPAPHG